MKFGAVKSRIISSMAAGVCAFSLLASAYAAPLPDAARQAMSSIAQDPAPPALVRDSHYWVSNENAHNVWYNVIRNLGGAFIGVGTDQVYLLAGWTRAEVIIPMDFDAKIRDLHFAYGAAFRESADIETFRSFWRPEAREKMNEALVRHFGAQQAALSMDAWRVAQPRVHSRLRKTVNHYTAKGIPTFVTDASTYSFIRGLWQDGRVFPVRGDATGSVGMRAIANALERANIKVGAVYLSNVEQYITYDPQTRRNFISLPWADNGLMLRTRPMASLGLTEEDCEYHYNYQSGLNFRAWLENNRTQTSQVMMRSRTRTSTPGLSVLNVEPPVSDPKPTVAAP